MRDLSNSSSKFSIRALPGVIRRTLFGVGLAGFGFGIALSAFVPAAQAANFLELNFWLSGPRYDGVVPPCEAGLNTVASRFAEKEGTFWNSSLQITGYAEVREIAFRPWTSDNMPRRYCAAHAMLSDGKPRQVYYSLIEDGGFAGYGAGVEFCVVGLDRNWAFNPACKAARP